MNNISEFFDTLLTHSYRYPATLWHIIFLPSSVFSDDGSTKRCPPGLSFFYTMVIVYITYNFAIDDLNKQIPKWLSTNLLLAIFIVYFSLIANLQRIVIGEILKPELSTDEQIKYLFYPICIVQLLLTPLPFVRSLTGNPLISTQTLVVFAHIIYILALYNVFRHGFCGSSRSSLKAASAAYFILIIISVGMVGLAILLR